MILWRDSVRFGKNFFDGAILEVILLESRSKLSHLGRRGGQDVWYVVVWGFFLQSGQIPSP